MIRKSSKVYPSLSEDNNNDQKKTTASTDEQVKLKKAGKFFKEITEHHIIIFLKLQIFQISPIITNKEDLKEVLLFFSLSIFTCYN
jgi:hypothetical protein